MRYRTVTLISLIAIAFGAGFGSLGCDSSSETEEPGEQEAQVDDTTTSPNAEEAFDDAAEWLPADHDTVLIVTGQPIWESINTFLMPTAIPKADAGADKLGTVEGLRSDLKDVFDEELGFDPLVADTAVVGAPIQQNPLSVVTVVFGQFDEPQGLPAVDVGGQTVYELPLHDFGIPTRAVNALYVAPIEEPRRGAVVTANKEQLAELIQTRDAGEGDETLASTSAGDDFARLFGDVEPASIALVTTSESLALVTGGRIPTPEWAGVGLGPGRIAATFEGSSEQLETLETLVSTAVGEMEDELERDLAGDPSHAAEHLTHIYLEHAAESLIRQLEPQRDDGQLRYEVAMVDASPYTVYLVGIGAALAVPAFVTYMNRAKASEADAHMAVMADGARAYFEGSQTYSTQDGAEPWHADGGNPGDPVGVDDKVFPGGPGIKVVSTPRTPQGGDKVAKDPRIEEGDADFKASDVFDALDVDFPQEKYFRYTYETGPGTGDEATATLKATHNFDPSTPWKHTVTQNIEVMDGGVVRVQSRFTEHEFE